MSAPSKSSSNKEDITSGKIKAPDGGWGWVVVAGATILNFLIGGAVNTFGVLYVALLARYDQGAGTTAWVGSMANAMGLLLGPLSSALSNRFSCRKMVILGGLLTSLGWITTGFMPRIEYMFITYGLLAGIGKSFSFTPSILIVGQWFDKKRSLANGISVAGAGFGTFAFAPLLETLLTKFGFTTTMIIMGGVMLVMSVCGVLFRPVPKIDCANQSPVSVSDNRETNEQKCVQVKTVSYPDVIMEKKIVVEDDIAVKKEERKTLKDYLDYTLIKDPKFLFFGVSLMLATLGHSPASVMLPPLAQQHDVTAEKSAFLLSITGIADIIGRLCFGAVCDIKALQENRKYLYVASIFISGIANITCGFAIEYWHFATYSVIFGLFAGSYNALTPVILVDLLGVDNLSSSFGLSLLFQGAGFLLGPPIAGWMRDGFGTYQTAFYFAGVSMIISSLIINCSSLCRCNRSPLRSGREDRTVQNEIFVLNNNVPKMTSFSVIITADENSSLQMVSTSGNPGGAYLNLAYLKNDSDEKEANVDTSINTRL